VALSTCHLLILWPGDSSAHCPRCVSDLPGPWSAPKGAVLTGRRSVKTRRPLAQIPTPA